MPKKIVPRKIVRLPMKFRNTQTVKQYFTGNFTREQIRKYVQKQSDAYAAKGFKGMISATLLYPEGWRSGYLTHVGEPIYLYQYADSDFEEDDPDNFRQFEIYLLKLS